MPLARCRCYVFGREEPGSLTVADVDRSPEFIILAERWFKVKDILEKD